MTKGISFLSEREPSGVFRLPSLWCYVMTTSIKEAILRVSLPDCGRATVILPAAEILLGGFSLFVFFLSFLSNFVSIFLIFLSISLVVVTNFSNISPREPSPESLVIVSCLLEYSRRSWLSNERLWCVGQHETRRDGTREM